MSKETTKQTAAMLFASTAHQILWANPKGEFFTSENLGNLSLKAGEKLEKFERPEADAKEAQADKPLNATDTIALLQKVESLDDLKAFEADERKSVIEAYTKKEAELIDAIPVIGLIPETGANGNEDTEAKPQI